MKYEFVSAEAALLPVAEINSSITNQHTKQIPNDLIQRPQSLFLASAFILNLIVFFTPIYRHAVNDPSAWIGTSFAVLLTASMLISLVAIFLYGNRINQLKWVKVATFIQIAALAVASAILFTMGGFGRFLWRETGSTGFILLALVALWQAGRFIKKDQELVESMDRIR
ncbi:DUF4293 family protein [Rhodohalobacter sp. SW132]|uniref:DUF4293 family protein n=1 Tax=Rhodohalobacter sp. SW132 TaxID=2293433 RepID=UPI001F259833|nr:DUF4293 family protein [Rhodohalobacter sp. SW132]